MSNLYRGPSIDASYQVSVQLTKQFQGRRFLEIDQSETRIACSPQAILVFDWLISMKSSPLKPLSQIK
jgi:phospholipid N-methyltransferase